MTLCLWHYVPSISDYKRCTLLSFKRRGKKKKNKKKRVKSNTAAVASCTLGPWFYDEGPVMLVIAVKSGESERMKFQTCIVCFLMYGKMWLQLMPLQPGNYFCWHQEIINPDLRLEGVKLHLVPRRHLPNSISVPTPNRWDQCIWWWWFVEIF